MKFWAVGGWAWVRGVCGVSQGKKAYASAGHRAKGWSQGKGLVTGQNPLNRLKMSAPQ